MPSWITALPSSPHAAASLHALRDRRVRALVRHAVARSPFHRERFRAAGLRPHDVRTAADLERLPALERADLLDHMDALLAGGVDLERCILEKSNGTTGEPLFLPCRRNERLFKHALWFAGYMRCGLRPWHRQAKFMFAATIPKRRWFFQHAGLFRRAYFPVSAPTAEKIRWLRDVRPDAVIAWGSVLTEIGMNLEENDATLDIPVVISSSDAIQRSHVVGRIRGRLSDVYGAMETGPLGWPCATHGGYHIDTRWNVVELLDDAGRPAPSGRVVCTVLWRRTVPLLRYNLGDLATWAREPCACGSAFPRIATLDGRQPDVFRLANGERLSCGIMGSIVRTLHGIRQYQLVQVDRGRGTFFVVPGDGYDDATERALQQQLVEHFGLGMSVRIVRVGSIHRPREEKLSSAVTLERFERLRARGVDVSPWLV